MIARKIAKRALGAVWLAMVDLAEGGHDQVVKAQREAAALDAAAIAERATASASLAQTAAVLALGLEDARP